jgi:hypothetical protein
MLHSRGGGPGPPTSAVGVAQQVELLVVVQAVAGSSPVAHPPPEGPHLQAFRDENRRCRQPLL